jgi:hypothetical protein
MASHRNLDLPETLTAILAGTAPQVLSTRKLAPDLQRGRIHRRIQRSGDSLPLPRKQNPDPVDTETDRIPSGVNIGQGTRRARCVETRTPGSADGLGKRARSNPGTAPQADPTYVLRHFAELAGHANLETIRRYSLPTTDDRQQAVNAITIDY